MLLGKYPFFQPRVTTNIHWAFTLKQALWKTLGYSGRRVAYSLEQETDPEQMLRDCS